MVVTKKARLIYTISSLHRPDEFASVALIVGPFGIFGDIKSWPKLAYPLNAESRISVSHSAALAAKRALSDAVPLGTVCESSKKRLLFTLVDNPLCLAHAALDGAGFNQPDRCADAEHARNIGLDAMAESLKFLDFV